VNIPPNVEWSEARLAVFMEISRLDDESKRLSIQNGTMSEKLETKFTKDLHECFQAIRRVSKEVENLRLKAATLGGTVGALVALLTMLVGAAIRHFVK
jgi:hypothetical protein